MRLKNYHKVLENTSEEEKENIKLSMDILERLNELLELKFGGKQKLLAERMGKSEAEVSKWFSGIQNFTQKTLVKLQVAFGEPIIAVCTHTVQNATFTQVKAPYRQQCKELHVTASGYLHEHDVKFEPVKPVRRKGSALTTDNPSA